MSRFTLAKRGPNAPKIAAAIDKLLIISFWQRVNGLPALTTPRASRPGSKRGPPQRGHLGATGMRPCDLG